jgi:hypothetical protein
MAHFARGFVAAPGLNEFVVGPERAVEKRMLLKRRFERPPEASGSDVAEESEGPSPRLEAQEPTKLATYEVRIIAPWQSDNR